MSLALPYITYESVTILQNKMFLTLKLLANRHPTFIARTVFVKNNDIDSACRIINRILGKEGILEQYRLTRYYEKPFQVKIIISTSQ